MAAAIYIPSLALSVVSPLSLAWSIVLTSVICTFYTTLVNTGIIQDRIPDFNFLIVSIKLLSAHYARANTLLRHVSNILIANKLAKIVLLRLKKTNFIVHIFLTHDSLFLYLIKSSSGRFQGCNMDRHSSGDHNARRIFRCFH